MLLVLISIISQHLSARPSQFPGLQSFGKAQQLLSLLNSVGAAANSAAAAAGSAANAAGSAAAKISALGKIQRGNFSYGGVQGE